MKKKAGYYNNVYKDIEKSWRNLQSLDINTIMKEVV
jgi:hypothetical protein